MREARHPRHRDQGQTLASMDMNLFHTSYEGAFWKIRGRPRRRKFSSCRFQPERAPAKAREVEIEYVAGNPVAVDGKKMSPAALLGHLNKLGGEHGVGRVDLVENRYVGMKSRGVYETPGGTILHAAHRGLESLTMDREVLHLRDSLIPALRRADLLRILVCPEREMLQVALMRLKKDVTGTVRVKLYKGTCTVVGRKSPRSLYRLDMATFEEDDVYRQKDAEDLSVSTHPLGDSRTTQEEAGQVMGNPHPSALAGASRRVFRNGPAGPCPKGKGGAAGLPSKRTV